MSAVHPADVAVAASMLCREIAESYDLLVTTTAGLGSPEDLALILADLRDLKSTAGEVYSQVEHTLLGVMGEKQVEVAGLGVVEIKRRTKRTAWRHDELIPVVVARALDERRVDEETGEFEREAHAVARVLRDCVSFGAGKVTGLRARGITPDEFCQETVDGYSVVLPPRSIEDRVA